MNAPAYMGGGMPRMDVRSPARLHYATTNRKLAPVRLEENDSERLRPVAVGPYCSATYVSIDATCPSSCRFKEGACYVRAGFTGRAARLLDEAAEGLSPEAVIDAEARAIDQAFGGWERKLMSPIPQDGARGGRDLRLHVGGDVPSTAGAVRLAGAAIRWRQRGGGAVWTFTHRWARIARESFGPISVLASVETVEDARRAAVRGYVPAIVVPEFPSDRAFRLRGLRGLRVIPCPAETRKRTCIECRLCLDDRKLRRLGVAIGFALHGQRQDCVRLPILEARR